MAKDFTKRSGDQLLMTAQVKSIFHLRQVPHNVTQFEYFYLL